MKSPDRVSTGLKGLDEIIDNLKIGDNVVWRVDDIEEYAFFVRSYVSRALKDNRRVVYMRFAQHKPLVKQHPNVRERAPFMYSTVCPICCRHGPPI